MCNRNTPSTLQHGAGTGWLVRGRRTNPGDWQWFFSSSVDAKRLEAAEKLRKECKPLTADIRTNTIEHYGVAIMVHKRWWHNIQDVRPAGSRMMSLEIEAKPKTRIIAAYAPHAYRPQEEKESFYDELNCQVKEGAKGGMTIIAGDLNARLGKPVCGEEAEILGRSGYAERELANEGYEVQENRDLLLQFCKINRFVVANTRFDKTAIKKVTYRRPGTPVNQKIENGGFEQIDFIILNRRFKNGIIDAESDGKAQIKSDHFPVKCKIACRLKEKMRNNLANLHGTRKTSWTGWIQET